MKIKDIDGFKYSRDSFDGYKMRVKLEILSIDDVQHNVDIYSSSSNVKRIKDALNKVITEKVKSFEIVHSATVEQDEAAGQLIDETLKNWPE